MSESHGRLPADGPEREIFLNALGAYRDACQPPELTPGCPFFTWTANGPACGEQCTDLLAQHGREATQDRFDLGGGIVLIKQGPRRRPRHGPGAADRPFDARQIYLSDENRPHADRRTVALIVELENLLDIPPAHWDDPGERSYDIQAVREQLQARGFDVDSLIRCGVGALLPMSITAYVLLPMMKADVQLRPIIDAMPPSLTQVDDDWQKFFDEAYMADIGRATEDRHAKLHYALHGFLDRLRNWLVCADINDIVMWRTPSCDTVGEFEEEEKAEIKESRRKAMWLYERFTKLYPGDWSISSLHLEWLYLHGRIPAPCSSAAMAERRMDSSDIAAAIAEETTDRWRRVDSERDSRAADFVSVAAGHLRDGNPELAAAIFEALTYVNPNDAEALNNYGFCLLAIDHHAALRALRKANAIYRGANLVTVANVVLALHLVGDDEDAYAMAIAESTRSLPSDLALLWQIDGDDKLALSADWIDARGYLTGLVEHIDNGCARLGLLVSDGDEKPVGG